MPRPFAKLRDRIANLSPAVAAGLRRLLHLSLAAGGICVAGFAAVVALAPRLLYPLLTSHDEVIDLAARFGWWLIPVLLFGAAAYIYDGFFLGLTMGRTLRNSMLLATIFVFAPIAALAVARGSNTLLWSAMAAWMAARAATLGWASRRVLADADAGASR